MEVTYGLSPADLNAIIDASGLTAAIRRTGTVTDDILREEATKFKTEAEEREGKIVQTKTRIYLPHRH